MIYVVNYGTPLSEVQTDTLNSLVALGTTPSGSAITKDGSGNFVNTVISGGGSPLTTKGDLYTFTTVDARLGVGTDGYVLTADSSTATGLKWAAVTGTGTVTSVSVVSANGFAGSVATATTTPAITLSTTITGLLKGNGTAISAAVSGTDYAPATSGTSILKGNGSGGFSNASAGTDYEVPLTFSTGLTRTTNTVTVNTTQNIAKLSNLTTNGFVKTSGGDGTLSIDTNTYITGNQTITLSGDITGSGTTGITTAIAAGVIVDADVNASAGITLSKLAALTVSRALVSDGSGVISVSSVTSTELGYLSGVTSAIQTQINAKGAGTVTSVGWTGGIVSVATATTTPAFTIAGTSGGIPYFSSGSTWATSAALAASALVIGGGAGVAPSTITTGTGVVTALGVNVGTAGSILVNGGALGTPSSGTVTNLTGTASININGTVGATTPAAGTFTTLVATAATSLLLGTAGSAVGNIGFRNATSGTITLAPVAGALGTVTLSLPAATDQLVARATTDTLTNKRMQPRTASSTTSSNLSPDLSTANVYYRTTQTATLTIDAPTGTPVIGETIMIYVDSAGAQTLTINATYVAFGAAFPAATTAGKTFMMSAQFNGTNWKTLWANAV